MSTWLDVQPSPWDSDLPAIARVMFSLMMRNVVGAGLAYEDPDPANAGAKAVPGCVLASPSFPSDFPPARVGGTGDWTPDARQNYVHNWTRDAAIVALEMCAPGAPISADELAQRMADYVRFAALCQQHAPPGSFDRGCFTIDGQPRDPWSDQSDGPALQTIALLGYYARFAPDVQATAKGVIQSNVNFLLGAWDQPTTSPWEEESGHSLFAQSVQLRCLQMVKDGSLGITVPDAAISGLQAAVGSHWGEDEMLHTFELGWQPSNGQSGYDPNIDVVLAALLGALPVDDHLIATARALRAIWDVGGAGAYPINKGDRDRGLGPLMGRYPGDHYDGDTDDSDTGHPWALCTCAMAELYHRLATGIEQGDLGLPADQGFLSQIGAAGGDQAGVVAALRGSGDRMLRAVVFHSDNLELSEQFDEYSGFQKSVSNLTWSYAAFLSAVRARA